MNQILVLVDVQESFRHRDYWDERRAASFLAQANALVAHCDAHGVPIVRVYHCETAVDSPFNEASGYVRPLQGLMDFEAALVVKKQKHSALVGTKLLCWLRDRDITNVMIAGIRTEQCCETTTRHLSDEGFSVTFVTDATLTFDMTSPDGLPVSADDIHRRTETVLNKRFASIAHVRNLVADTCRDLAET
ncbi:MAG TPA: isochorismatase family protein [Advenella sp.]|nr:isochorismatase family protein [Advenella sp.]